MLAALEDDLNTPLALSHLYETMGALNRATASDERARLAGELSASGALLGLLEADPEAWFTATSDGIDAAQIEARIAARNAARKARNFAEADRIRDELAARRHPARGRSIGDDLAARGLNPLLGWSAVFDGVPQAR